MGNKNSSVLKWKPLSKSDSIALLRRNVYDPSNKDNDYMEHLDVPKSASLDPKHKDFDIQRDISPSLKLECQFDMVQSCIDFDKL